MKPLSETVTNGAALILMVMISIMAMPGVVNVAKAQSTPPPFVILNEQATPSLTLTGVSKVTLSVEYTGGYYLYDVYFQLQPCGNFTVSPSSIYVGWVNPGQQLSLTYLINGTLPINCQATLSVSWGGESKYSQLTSSYVSAGGSGSTSVTFPLVIYGEPNLIINVTQGYLIYGYTNPLTITLVNNGSGPIYNMAVTIQATGAYLSPGVGSFVINDLNPGGLSTIGISLIPTSTSPMDLTITYSGITQNGNSVSGTMQVSLSVVSVSPSQVTVYPINTTLNPGLGVLVLGVRNLNPTPIYNVTIQLTSTQGLTPLANTLTVPVIPSNGYLMFNVPVVVQLTAASASMGYVLSFQLPNGYVSSGEGTVTVSAYGVTNPITILLTNSTLNPGLGELTIGIVNSAPTPLYNVSLILNPTGGLSLGASKISITEVPPRGTYYVSIPVTALPSAGTASVGYTLYYYLTPTGAYGGSLTGSLPINIITPQSVLTIYPLNPTLSVGNDTIDVVIRSNVASSLGNVTLTVTSVQGASTSTTSYPIGYLPPYGTFIVKLPLTVPLTSGSVTINYVVTYSLGNYLNTINGALNLGVSSPPSIAVTVYPLNSTLNVGLGRLILGIRNNEPVPLQNVTLILNSVGGISISDTQYSIGEVEAGGTYYLAIPVAVPSTSGSASLSYTLTYSYTGGEGSVEGQLNMGVAGLPQILITGYTVAPTVATVGTDVSISLTLVNSGPVMANNLNVTMLTTPGLIPISGSSIYLGSLGSQSLSSVAFTLLPVRPINGSVLFIVTYTDQYGQAHVIYYRVPIKVLGNSTFFRFSHFHNGSRQPNGGFGFTHTSTALAANPLRSTVIYVAVAVVVIVVAVVVVLMKVRRQ